MRMKENLSDSFVSSKMDIKQSNVYAVISLAKRIHNFRNIFTGWCDASESAGVICEVRRFAVDYGQEIVTSAVGISWVKQRRTRLQVEH